MVLASEAVLTSVPQVTVILGEEELRDDGGKQRFFLFNGIYDNKAFLKYSRIGILE